MIVNPAINRHPTLLNIVKWIGFLLFFPVCLSTAVFAAEISEMDIGTYAVKTKNGVSIYYRLSKIEGKFILEDTSNMPVYCAANCDFKASGETDLHKIFTEYMLRNFVAACIHNAVMAFCHFSQREKQDDKIYALFTLFTPKPVFIPIQPIAPELSANESFKRTGPALNEINK